MSSHESGPVPTPVVEARGDLDAETLGPLAAELEDAAAGHSAVVLDARGVTFGDSSFLRLVMIFHQRTDLRIAAPGPAVTRLFELVRVDTVLRLYPSVEAALGAPPAA
ncbi:STAS domain-containing protein [Streptomyces sp. NBC_01477]|uniref:STAS domain-containing protein n=1 Tax=Streptomyces sp. NBC_01477 TaxID=2976015 RepID=UPI002E37DD10|nr:STAS domain-containing protein [Streptomyces sp. NBC_01477]